MSFSPSSTFLRGSQVVSKHVQCQSIVNYRNDCSVPLFSNKFSSTSIDQNKIVKSKEAASNNNDYEWLKQSRPVRIYAEPLSGNGGEFVDEHSQENCKIVHFVRHGQGTHNEIYRLWTEKHGKPLDLSETDPQKNPLLLPNVIDAPLTEKGRNQCMDQRLTASKLLDLELVVASPLVRTLQTAQLTFADHLPDATDRKVTWLAHEGCREELGLLLCNQRRPLSQTKPEFPHVDFSHISHHGDDDIVWDNHFQQTVNEDGIAQRESMVDMSHRCYDFLVNFLRKRDEKVVAVVGHSAWFLAMSNAVLDCGDNNCFLPMFGQAELRSMKLTFTPR